jgi:ABC-type amino acid transport substrate-binding protein
MRQHLVSYPKPMAAQAMFAWGAIQTMASQRRLSALPNIFIPLTAHVFRCARLGGLLTAAAILCVYGVNAENAGPLNRDLDSITADGFIRVAMTRFDLPAFHKRGDNGSVNGLEADLSREIANALNIKAAFNTDYGSFDAVAEAVANGQADIGLSKLSQTYYRVKKVRFSEPYITLHHAMLYDRVAIAGLANGGAPEDVMRNFHSRIGVIGESAYVDFGRRNFPDATIVTLSNWDKVVAALKEGLVQAIYRDEFEIRRVLKTEPALNVRFGTAVITDQNAFLSIAICDSCAKLQQFINYHLREYPRVFTIDDLLKMAGQK